MIQNKNPKKYRKMDMRRRVQPTQNFSYVKPVVSEYHPIEYTAPEPTITQAQPDIAPTSTFVLPKSNFGLKRRLHQIEKLEKAAHAKRDAASQALSEKRHHQEELQQRILTLLEERASLKHHYLSLFHVVLSRFRVAARKSENISEQISAKKTEYAAQQGVLLGLHTRRIRNAQLLWTERLRQFQESLRIAHRKRQEIEQEIRILFAKRHGIGMKLRRIEVLEEQVAQPTRRRGKIIAGRDLSLLSEHIAAFSKKNTPSRVQIVKKKKTRGKPKLHTLRDEYIIAISEQKRVAVKRRAKIDELYLQTERLSEEISTLQLQRDQVEEQISIAKLQAKKVLRLPRVSFSGLTRSLRKQALTFAAIALVLTTPLGVLSYIQKGSAIKSQVLGASTQAVDSLLAASSSVQNSDFSNAEGQFQSAAEIFQNALNATNSIGVELITASRALPQANLLAQGHDLLVAAQSISQAGSHLTAALATMNGVSVAVPGAPTTKAPSTDKNIQSASPKLTDALTQAKADFVAADTKMQIADRALQKISPGQFPESYQSKIALAKDLIPKVAGVYHGGVTSLDALLELLGANGKRRYLLVFQNNTEIRGTGGFIGSYGLADIDQGSVTNIKIEEIYKPDGQLLSAVYPPAPLRNIAPKWFTRDANWYPDFPTAAQDIEKLYEKTGGPSVDGVISLTPTVLERILAVTGPVEVPEHKVTVNTENFLSLTQYKVEIDYDKQENTPKKFLADMMPHILGKLFSLPKEKWLDVASTLQTAANEKHILAYFFDEAVQARVKDAGLAGEMKAVPADFLSIVNSNIRGQKTDGLIQEKIQHVVNVDRQGSLTETLTVTRTHTGDNTFPSGRNRDYVRIYVPKGAKLVSATGFPHLAEFDEKYECKECTSDPEISAVEATYHHDDANNIDIGEELGKTVFGGWLALDPGTNATYQVTYTLPNMLSFNALQSAKSYSVYVQKQSGSLGSEYALEIHIPVGYDYAKVTPVAEQQVVSVKNGLDLKFATRLNQDRFMGAVITK